MNELNSLRTEVSNQNNEINNLHTLVDKIQDDKNKLSKKISKLLDNGKFEFYIKNNSKILAPYPFPLWSGDTFQERTYVFSLVLSERMVPIGVELCSRIYIFLSGFNRLLVNHVLWESIDIFSWVKEFSLVVGSFLHSSNISQSAIVTSLNII